MKPVPNEQEARKLRVVLFSGARATSTICEALLRHPRVAVTVLVSPYEDGDPTGRLRELVPGLPGVSEARRWCSRLMPDGDGADRALRALVDHRLPASASFDFGVDCLDALATLGKSGAPDALRPVLDALRLEQARVLARAAERFLWHVLEQPSELAFGGSAIGDLVLAGMFLEQQAQLPEGRGSFDDAMRAFSALLRTRGTVLDATGGQPLALVGLGQGGTLLGSETELRAMSPATELREVYVLPAPLSTAERERLEGLSESELDAELRAREISPPSSPASLEALAQADIVVHGPGAAHGATFPSHLGAGIGEAVAANARAEKLLVADGPHGDALASRLVHHASRKGQVRLAARDLVTTTFDATKGAPGATLADVPRASSPPSGTATNGATNGTTNGATVGGRIAAEIVQIASQRVQRELAPYPHTVSIIVPGRDEVATLGAVLQQLTLLDFAVHELGKEIIYVDEGSTDGSREAAAALRSVRCEASTGGRGNAFRRGLEVAQGDVVVFFPSNGEYDPADVLRIVEPIVAGRSRVVFGHRSPVGEGGAPTLTDRQIPASNRFGYLVGKYGGATLDVLGLVLLDRYVNDYISGLKAFDARLLRELELTTGGIELETELVAKLSRRKEPIAEVPVAWRPGASKKPTLKDGLRAMGTLVRYGVTS